MSNIYSVSEVNERIKSLLDTDFTLQEIFVRGEISNYKKHSSGHHYFSLKDKDGVISAVLFKFDASKVKFTLKDGLKVISFGRVSSFVKTGQYQLYVKDVVPDGIGDLHLAYEELKQKLYKEGLFDEKNKQTLPRFPEKIAVVTSRTGAVFSDITRVISGRYKCAEIKLFPVKVQGEGAAEEISEAINQINNQNEADVIIIGRGGGSIEDLWAFNDENLAYTIFASNIPIISAVGHEPDYTISDFVADVRAATPSNAGEIVVPDSAHIKSFLQSVTDNLTSNLHLKMQKNRQKVDLLNEKIVNPHKLIADKRIYVDFLQNKLKNPTLITNEYRSKIHNLSQNLEFSYKNHLSKDKQKLISLMAYLDGYSPMKVLSRGYGYSLNNDKKIIKSVSQIKIGEEISTKFSDGSIKSKIIEIED